MTPAESQVEFDEKTPHVLIVDDDRRLRGLLQRYLQDSGFRVTTAGDANEARAHLVNLSFDLIVLDVMMPGESGFDLTQALRSHSDVPIMLLTARGTPEDRIAGLERGADDYVPKPFEPRELVLRIQTIIRRARKPDPAPKKTLSFGVCRFDIERGELTRDGRSVRLTSTELSLLRLFAGKPGTTFSRMDLCAHTGASLERTVDVQVTRLRRKIEPDPRAPVYLQTVRGAGYALMPD